MIHVRVREQHQINPGQLPRGKRGRDEALGSDGADQHVRSRVIHEQGIRQDIHAIKIDEHRGMAEPCGSDAVRVPKLGRGREIRRENFPAGLGHQAARRAGSQGIRARIPCADETRGTGGCEPPMRQSLAMLFQMVRHL